MTFAPPTILAARAYLKGQDVDLSDVELGITGGPSHILAGTSYHLGADQLKMSKNPYSARTSRDRAGLSNAASALDIDDDLNELRALSVWMVAQCRAGAADTLDIREIIYSPDGVNVLRWDRERGQNSAPQSDSDLSHRTHTHVSWYRDSEFRDKTALFRRFFQGDNDMNADQDAKLEAIFKVLIPDPPVRVQGAWTFTRPDGRTVPINPLYRAIDAVLETVEKIGTKVGVDPAELAAIRDAARQGAESGVVNAADELVAAFVAALPDDVASREDVVSALREVLLTGVGGSIE